MHKCDNPSCVNPSHLILGTQADNNADTAKKGRGRNRPHRGEDHPRSKLTADDVRKIRRDRRSRKAVADQYGIHPHHVSHIRNRRVWTHIE